MPIYDIDGNETNTLYDIDGHSISSAYDISGNQIPLINFLNSAVVTDVYVSTISNQPQGGCIDDDENVYVCFHDSGRFRKYNITSGTLTEYSFTASEYGHANGMAYNPNTEYLYLASMNTTGEVYVFDKSFNLIDTLYAKNEKGNIINCWNIAYDRKHNRFITMANNKVIFYDDNLEYISHVSYVSSEVWPYTAQDIETDGNFIYAVGWNTNHITVLNMNGDIVKFINNTAYTGEPESLCYDWINDKYYMEGKNSSSKFVIRQEVFIEN